MNINKKINLYKLLIIIGSIPFIGILFYGFYNMLTGFTFMFSPTTYGIKAFIESIYLISIFIWPIYIIGILLIVISKIKISKLNKKEMK